MKDLFYVKVAAIIVVVTVIAGSFFLFRKKRKEITMLLVSCIFSLLLCEVLLRMFYPQVMDHDEMFVYDSELGWKFIPGKQGNIVYYGEVNHSIKINSLGFRDHSEMKTKEKKKPIMVLGDSFVSNISVHDDEVFTEVMEQEFHATDVLNFGVNGYNQVQEYLLLKNWIDRINPSLIVLMIYIRNDFTENTGIDKWLFERPYASVAGTDSVLTFHSPPEFQAPTESPWKLYRKSHVYTLVDRGLLHMTLSFQGNDGIIKPSFYAIPESYLCHNELSQEVLTLHTVMEKLLLSISALAYDKKVPLVMVVAPSMVQVQDDLWRDLTAGTDVKAYTRSLPNDRLMLFAKKNNLEMIDLLPVLQLKSREGKKLYNVTDQHWSAEGNRVVADALVDYLRSNSLAE